MKRVIVYSTFSPLYYGRINLFQRAKVLGGYPIVVLGADEFNWNEKRKKRYFPARDVMGSSRPSVALASDPLLGRIGVRGALTFTSTTSIPSSWATTGRRDSTS